MLDHRGEPLVGPPVGLAALQPAAHPAGLHQQQGHADEAARGGAPDAGERPVGRPLGTGVELGAGADDQPAEQVVRRLAGLCFVFSARIQVDL